MAYRLFARIKHDTAPRNNGLSIYPETVPLQNSPKGTGKGILIPYPDQWEDWTRGINSQKSGLWLFSVGSMLFNKEYTTTPLAESITNAGNVVSVTTWTTTHARLQTYRNNLPVPANTLTFENRPHLIHKVVCIKGSTLQLYNPSGGLDIYFPLLARADYGLWIPLERLEFFPIVPRFVRPKETVWSFASPKITSRIVRKYTLFNYFKIYEYAPMGCDVWGRIGDNEWVRLQSGNTFYTNWKMLTQTPIPPV